MKQFLHRGRGTCSRLEGAHARTHTQGKLQLKTKLRSVFGISILDCISHTLNFDLSDVITRIY
jgi:hypothetical protein